MARTEFTAHTGGEVALTGGAEKTVLQVLAPSDRRLAITGFSVSFDGTAGNAAPVLIYLIRQTTAGTMASATVIKRDPDQAIDITATQNASAEPTTDEIIRIYEVHPQTGIERPFDDDDEILVVEDGRLGIVCEAPANVNVTAFLDIGLEAVSVPLQALPTSLTAAETAACSLTEIYLVNVTDQPQRVSVRNGAGGAYFMHDRTIPAREYLHEQFSVGIPFTSGIFWIAENVNSVNGAIRGKF